MNEIININSVADYHRLAGLQSPKHPLVSVSFHKDTVPSEDFAGQRYAFGLYYISYKNGKYARMGYGRSSYDFQEGTLMFMSPGQVISPAGSSHETDEGGWSLAFHPDLIRKSALGEKIGKYSFFSYDVNEALHVSESEIRILTELTQKIIMEYNQNIDQHTQNLIISNIELLLDYCNRYYDRQFYTRTNLNKDCVTRFEQLLHNYSSSGMLSQNGIPGVSYFGEKLNMSGHYLSDMLKKETGKSLKKYINDFLINNAKTMLLGSADSVSQIAYSLGFEYPQHFSKLFKQKTGMSPVEYRSLN
ncbi:AraC family transcriptional regulator [Flavobacterium sp. NRK1]|uniref:helix-turn-helix domain-containing protein n=1 Tax=Flavobacterium sp. NRK1 TaxID=2954929 RepID=UPI0020928AC7|nr:helix-turn-helix transcriptional regulator [Flavobacterium sp. NRK1]MCO6146560.1 helix-turn-helix transcriptional regulator [Flavobacterium sp. NRK1]